MILVVDTNTFHFLTSSHSFHIIHFLFSSPIKNRYIKIVIWLATGKYNMHPILILYNLQPLVLYSETWSSGWGRASCYGPGSCRDTTEKSWTSGESQLVWTRSCRDSTAKLRIKRKSSELDSRRDASTIFRQYRLMDVVGWASVDCWLGARGTARIYSHHHITHRGYNRSHERSWYTWGVLFSSRSNLIIIA